LALFCNNTAPSFIMQLGLYKYWEKAKRARVAQHTHIHTLTLFAVDEFHGVFSFSATSYVARAKLLIPAGCIGYAFREKTLLISAYKEETLTFVVLHYK
jgi:hypothetical protein